MNRVCKSCGIDKPITEYHKTKKSLGGYAIRCKICRNRINKDRRKTDRCKELEREYRRSEEYKDAARNRKINARAFNVIEREIKRRENKYIASFRYISKAEAIEFSLPRYFEGAECKRGHISERTTANNNCLMCQAERREQADSKKKKSEYYKRNKVELMKKNIEYQRVRYANDEGFKVATAARNMLKRVLRVAKKEKHGGSYEILGYSRDELMENIRGKFLDGMSWDNYGEWHIDHIKPVSLFIKEGETRPEVINSLENLQPLWKEDNLAKSNKF